MFHCYFDVGSHVGNQPMFCENKERRGRRRRTEVFHNRRQHGVK